MEKCNIIIGNNVKMDKAIIGYMRIGYFRIGVFRDDWDTMLEQCKNAKAPSFTDLKTQLKNVKPPSFSDLKKRLKEAY